MADVLSLQLTDAPSARVRSIEAKWPRSTRHDRLPKFWHDVEVRRAVIDLYGATTIDGALAKIGAEFGEARRPSRSAVGLFWKKLDSALKGR